MTNQKQDLINQLQNLDTSTEIDKKEPGNEIVNEILEEVSGAGASGFAKASWTKSL